MTSLKGDLRSIMGTPFGGVGHAVLIFSRVTRAAFNSDSVVLQLHDRIEMPEEADGKFQVDGLDPGPIRIELEGGTVHNHGWNIDLPDEGVWSLTDLVDAQVDWSPAVIGRAEAAARESREHADRAEAGADRVGTAEQVGTWASEASSSASAAASARSAAQTARNAAQSARDVAEGHANRAATSEANAAASESAAKQSETNAGDFAAVATTAATEAVDAMESASDAASSIGDSVNAAAGHADRASQYESGAAAYAQNASDAADRVGTAEQVGTWAQQAQDAADRIGTAETVEEWVDSARDSASTAAQSETKAKEYRDAAFSAASSTADELRGDLINIAGEASSHATESSRSAARAKTSETNAATHEANSLSAAARAEFAAEETIQQVEGDFATRNYVDASSFVKGSLGTVGGLEGTVSGVYTVNSQSAAESLGAPRPGTVIVSRYGSANTGQALLISAGANPEIWIAGKTSSGWQPWRRIDDQSYFKGALPSTGDKTLIDSGVYYISNQTQRDHWGAPTSGTVYVSRYGSSNIGQMMLITAAAPARIYVSNLVGSQGWSEFNEIGGGDSGGTTIIEGGSGAASGMKRIPLSVTLAQGSGNFARTSGTYRIPVNFNAPITRWRLHITDRNIHTGDHVGADINIQSIFVGDRDGQTANFTNAPAQIGENIALSDAPDGEWVSAWRDEPIGDGIERMISYQYTSTSAPFAGVGAAYNTSGMVAGDITPTQWASSTPNRMAAFDIWIEAETYATTPTVAVFGDSLSCGAGATLPGYDSVLNQYCRRIEALPVHFAAPGNAMQDWAGDVESYKFTRWEHLDRADAVIWAMGHNDVYRGRSFAQMRADFETLYLLVAERMAKTVFAATVTTRNEPSNTDMHGVRNQWNAWLKDQIAAQSDGRIRDVFDFAAVINSGDLIRTEYDSGDKVHLNTAGYTAEADSIDRPVTTPTVVHKSTNLYEGTGSPEGKVVAPIGTVYTDSAATNGAIRWVKTNGTGNTGWRVEYGDTGWRDISSLLHDGWSGNVYMIRVNDSVEFRVEGLSRSTTSNDIMPFPDGFLPRQLAQLGFRFNLHQADSTASQTRFRIVNGKFATFSWPTTQGPYYGGASWLGSETWPTTLPGIPA